MTTASTDRLAVDIRHLDVTFATDGGDVHAVRGVSLDVRPGELGPELVCSYLSWKKAGAL